MAMFILAFVCIEGFEGLCLGKKLIGKMKSFVLKGNIHNLNENRRMFYDD
jgi:hypothetical protein